MVLDKVAGVGIRQQQILVADQSREVATSGERVHAAWQLRRSRAIADGSRPSAIVRSVTEVAHDPSGNRAASEQHHLFPRAWLAKHGITDRRDLNQVGNLADLDWSENHEIGASGPAS